MSVDPLYLGLDLGTSGARAVVIDASGAVVAQGKAALAEFGANLRNPQVWRQAADKAVESALAHCDRTRVAAIAVDGTSGTMLAVDAAGAPLGDGLMYNDPSSDAAAVAAIANAAPPASAAHGPTSGLAKAMSLRALEPTKILHQADWIAWRFSGRFVSDANNALKTGYDAAAGEWPAWMARLGFDLALLPDVVEPGAGVGEISPAAADAFGLSRNVRMVAGTTDGCASFLATGAERTGDGVSALGTTLTLKLLSDRPIFAPEYGVYSHRILGNWLAGGASNAGGAVLLAFFAPEEIEALTPRLDPAHPTGLDYYPLLRPGERFPFADPAYAPRLLPRPQERAQFLQGLLEGIAGIEAQGYRRLAELGAPALKSVRSVGGGARNEAWTQIRAARLGAPMLAPLSDEAAYGSALLARRTG